MGRFGFIVVSIALLQTTINAQTYKTYYPWESDSVLVAWVIKKFADPKAKFVSVDKKKEKIGKENSINTSNSKLRRTARFTAFEMALKDYKVKESACTNRLKKIIRVLEMTPWKKHEYEEILTFEEGFISLFPKRIEDDNLTKLFEYIDNSCKGKK